MIWPCDEEEGPLLQKKSEWDVSGGSKSKGKTQREGGETDTDKDR